MQSLASNYIPLKNYFLQGRGRSAVAVVRISGYNAQTALQKMTNRDDFPPRQMALVNILHPLKKTLIDKGMIVYFPGKIY